MPVMTFGHAGKNCHAGQYESIFAPGFQSLSPLIMANAFWLSSIVAAGPTSGAAWATGLGSAIAAIEVLLVTGAVGVLAATGEMEVITLLASTPRAEMRPPFRGSKGDQV